MQIQEAQIQQGGSIVDPPVSSEPEEAMASAARPLALVVIAVLLIFYTLYLAASLFVPIAAAVLVSMLLSPAVGFIERIHVPRQLASMIVVITTVALIGTGMAALSGPAAEWIEKAPLSLHKLEERFHAVTKPIEVMQSATDQLKDSTQAGKRPGPQEVRVVRPALADLVLSGSVQASASMISVTILVYFLLASGDVFLRKLVTVIPTFRDKKRAVEITRQIETDISFYLLSFTLANVGLGVVMAVATALLGLPNPLLWGVLVAVLNFVPYVGALTSMAILTIVGVQSFDSLFHAFAAPAILLLLVGILAEVITPFILGRGLQLNPVAIFMSILMWGWLWGLVGVLLAVPLLASFKIICERVEPLHPVAEFLTI